MANYSTAAVSNLFRVKDEQAFLAWTRRCGLFVLVEENSQNYYQISAGEDHGSEGWPNVGYEEDGEEGFEVDICGELPRYLQEDSVAVLFETGGMHGSMPYGFAVAINSKGEEVSVNLAEIYAAAKGLGGEVRSLD